MKVGAKGKRRGRRTTCWHVTDIAYLATGLSFAAIDAAWLSRMGPTFYKAQLGEMMLARPRFDAAAPST